MDDGPRIQRLAFVASHIEHELRANLLQAAILSLARQTDAAFDMIVVSMSLSPTSGLDRDTTAKHLRTVCAGANIPLLLLEQEMPLRQFRHIAAIAAHCAMTLPDLESTAVVLFDDDDLAHPDMLSTFDRLYIQDGFGPLFAQSLVDLVTCSRLSSKNVDDIMLQRRPHLQFLDLEKQCLDPFRPSFDDFSGSLISFPALFAFLNGQSQLGDVDLDGRYTDGFFRLAMPRIEHIDTCLVWQRIWRIDQEFPAWSTVYDEQLSFLPSQVITQLP